MIPDHILYTIAHSKLHYFLFIAHCILYSLYWAHCALHNMLYTIHCTIYIESCTLYCPAYTLQYTIHLPVHTLQYTIDSRVYDRPGAPISCLLGTEQLPLLNMSSGQQAGAGLSSKDHSKQVRIQLLQYSLMVVCWSLPESPKYKL